MSAATGWQLPLQGVRVIDFSLLLPGPFATHLLAQMGAEVIKLEPPGGDPMRVVNPHGFAHLNRGKQSVCADLREPEGRALVSALVASADVVVEGFRPGVLAAAGLGFEQVSARHPHIIYASISAFGQDGPYARRPAHDVNVLAAAGYYAITLDLDDATLQRPRLRFADYAAGLQCAFAVAALLRTPRPQRVAAHLDASMFDAVAGLTLPIISTMTAEIAEDPTRRPDVLADVALYRTADGRAISIGTLEDKFWTALVKALAPRFPALADPAWAGRLGRTRDKWRLAGVLREVFGSMTLAEVHATLPADETCWAPVLRGTELLRDPQVLARGLVAEVPEGPMIRSGFAVNGQRASVEGVAPVLGADTERWTQALRPRRS